MPSRITTRAIGREGSSPRYKRSKYLRADTRLIAHTPYGQHEAPTARVRGKRSQTSPPEHAIAKIDKIVLYLDLTGVFDTGKEAVVSVATERLRLISRD